jgi:hypothetical protein
LHIKLYLRKWIKISLDLGFFKKKMFHRISGAKIQVGEFFGPKIRELIKDVKSEDQLSEVENAAWQPSNLDTTNFMGNHKPENYPDMVVDLAKSHKAIGCSMSLKVRFLDSHLDLFAEKLESTKSDFHQGISTMGNAVPKHVKSLYVG